MLEKQLAQYFARKCVTGGAQQKEAVLAFGFELILSTIIGIALTATPF